MRKVIFVVVAIFVCANLVFAKPPKEAKKEATTPLTATSDPKQQQKDMLIANINNMRNQEVRVAVMQQLLNEEIAKLRNVQQAFCDQYKLDVEKLRQGLYRYDEKEGKFVEQKSVEQKN